MSVKSWITARIIKQWITSLLGLAMAVLAGYIALQAGEFTLNSIVFATLGLICWGIPESRWRRVVEIVTRRNDNQQQRDQGEEGA